MDGNDFFDYFVQPLLDLDLSDLAKVADYALPKDWFLTQSGPDDTADLIADVIYAQYFDTGAADDWGPTTFFNWYVDGAISAVHYRSDAFAKTIRDWKVVH